MLVSVFHFHLISHLATHPRISHQYYTIATEMATCSFFKLPRELRDSIYEHYFYSAGGYAYDYDTGKLRAASGERIDLSLRLTCRLVADETRGLALKLNSLHFTTVYRNENRDVLGRFSALLDILVHHKADIIKSAVLAGCFDQPLCCELKRAHPHLQPVIDDLLARYSAKYPYPDHWKVPLSIGRRFVVDTLRLVSQQPNFAATMAACPYKRRADGHYGDALWLSYDPWIIPTTDEVNKLFALGFPLVPEQIKADYIVNTQKYFHYQKYRLSAASVAIHFLGSLSCTTRREVRKIDLHEDRVAIAWPESHAQGLIPFCRDNPQLRVERRVSLWRNALLRGSVPLFNFVHGLTRGNTNTALVHTLRGEAISRDGIASWITEALALPGLGMPANAFSLILECDGLPERSRQVFEIVKQDAAWQTAFEEWNAARGFGLEPWEWMRVRVSKMYIAQGFPHAVRSIIEGNSLVKCDFDLDNACDVDARRLVAEAQDWELSDWYGHWWDLRRAIAFDTEPPLPSWLDIRREDLLPSEDEASSQ